MTPEDANKVAAILAEADGGCSHCVKDLATMAVETWPEFDWFTMVGYPQSPTPGDSQ